jgi:HEAT repeat protein
LADEDTEVRITAAKALSQLAAFLTDDNLSAFQELLARALGDPSGDVQREAARALEAKGFVPTEQLADQIVAVWRQLDATDPQAQANRDQLAKSLKAGFDKNPGDEADRPWRQRILAAFAQQ